ncbi:hypothetical protein VN97_g12825 [Penicillium thymicola]|uniref:Uncharacterized protein n=1 Tax=Penicillium thymicola TaxID=293382 RepID=A0AAI9T6A2_PENTH|nr:hypothetical protein VN97_g12825 [Penicillium thymicola]
MTPTSSPSPKIKDVVVNILNTLKVVDHANLTKSEILDLGVSVKGFDPNDEDSWGPKTPWFFMPISKEDIKPWKISASEANSLKASLNMPNLDLEKQLRPDWDATRATQQVLLFITAQFNHRSKSKTRLSDTFGWSYIDFEEFTGGNKGFLFSTSGKCRGVDTPGWRLSLLEEWWDWEVLIGPSIRFIICTDGNGKEGSLLLGELGSIAQVVAFRRIQPGFETYRLFPVLLIPLFGPRHGRIIQACYDRLNDKLELRISRVFCFVTKEDEVLDTFLRFVASYPPEIANPEFSRLACPATHSQRPGNAPH